MGKINQYQELNKIIHGDAFIKAQEQLHALTKLPWVNVFNQAQEQFQEMAKISLGDAFIKAQEQLHALTKLPWENIFSQAQEQFQEMAKISLGDAFIKAQEQLHALTKLPWENIFSQAQEHLPEKISLELINNCNDFVGRLDKDGCADEKELVSFATSLVDDIESEIFTIEQNVSKQILDKSGGESTTSSSVIDVENQYFEDLKGEIKNLIKSNQINSFTKTTTILNLAIALICMIVAMYNTFFSTDFNKLIDVDTKIYEMLKDDE